MDTFWLVYDWPNKIFAANVWWSVLVKFREVSLVVVKEQRLLIAASRKLFNF